MRLLGILSFYPTQLYQISSLTLLPAPQLLPALLTYTLMSSIDVTLASLERYLGVTEEQKQTATLH